MDVISCIEFFWARSKTSLFVCLIRMSIINVIRKCCTWMKIIHIYASGACTAQFSYNNSWSDLSVYSQFQSLIRYKYAILLCFLFLKIFILLQLCPLLLTSLSILKWGINSWNLKSVKVTFISNNRMLIFNSKTKIASVRILNEI